MYAYFCKSYIHTYIGLYMSGEYNAEKCALNLATVWRCADFQSKEKWRPLMTYGKTEERETKNQIKRKLAQF